MATMEDVSTTAKTAARPVVGRRTTVALKIAMAVTGIIFILFVLAHMYGNLKVFSGQQAFDDYADGLRVLGEPLLPYGGFLWIMRVVLLVSLVIHVYAAWTLSRRAWAARGRRYVVRKAVQATLSSRTMRWGGLALLAFVIFHILQFTTLTIEIGGSFASPYDRVVAAFSVWYIFAIYAVAMIALGMHVRHGVWSAMQTLGWAGGNRRPVLDAAGIALALVLVIGFLAPPVAILLGSIN